MSTPNPPQAPLVVDTWGPKPPPRGYASGWLVPLGIFLAVALPAVPLIGGLILYVVQNTEAAADPGAVEDAITGGPLLVASAVFTWVGFLIAVWLGSRATTGGFKALTKWGFRWRTDLLIAVGFTALFRVMESVGGMILKALGVNTDELGNTDVLTNTTGIWLVFLLFGAAVIAPIVEEMFFRGLFLNVGLRKWSPVVAVVVTSLVFGLMHTQSSLTNTLYTVTWTGILGAGLALLVLKTDRLGPSVLSHILFNSSGVALALIVGS